MKRLALLLFLLFFTSCGLSDNHTRQEIEDSFSVEDFEILAKKFEGINGLHVIGERVNDFWVIGDNQLSKDSAGSSGQSLEEVCKKLDFSFEQVMKLQEQCKQMGVLQVQKRKDKLEFLMHRSSSQLRGNSFYFVKSERSPKDADPQYECKMLREGWWIVITL